MRMWEPRATFCVERLRSLGRVSLEKRGLGDSLKKDKESSEPSNCHMEEKAEDSKGL